MSVAVQDDAVDYAHTRPAEQNRLLKAQKLARWLWERALTYSDVLAADEKRRRAWARAAYVTPPSTMETWQAVNSALVAMEGFAEDHPGHPKVQRPHAAERATWLGVLEEPAPAPETAPEPVEEPPAPPNSPRPAVDDPTAPAAEVIYPRGWDQLAALGPIPRADARCKACRLPAITFTVSNGQEEWRCAGHPPQPGEWGATLDWSPRSAECVCAPGRCYCGRGDSFRLGGGGFRVTDSALLDERAAAKGKNRAPVHVREAARAAEEARKAARKGKS